MYACMHTYKSKTYFCHLGEVGSTLVERVEQRDESRTPQSVMLVGVTPRVVRVPLPEAETPRNAIVRIYGYTDIRRYT